MGNETEKVLELKRQKQALIDSKAIEHRRITINPASPSLRLKSGTGNGGAT